MSCNIQIQNVKTDEKIKQAIVDAISTKSRIAIYKSTGGSKTTTCLVTLSEMIYKGIVHKPIFIVPYSSIRDNLYNKWKSFLPITIDTRDFNNKILICCPEKLIHHPEVLDKADVFIIDEIHLIPNGLTFRVAYNLVNNIINNKSPVICLTGTPLDIIGINIANFDKVYDFGIQVDLRADIKIIEVNDVRPAVVDLINMIKTKKDNNTVDVLYWNSKNYLNITKSNFDVVITSETLSSKLDDARINKDTIAHKIIETGDISSINSIFCTSCFTTGLSIETEVNKVRIFAIFDSTQTFYDIHQLVNRFRNITSKTVEIILIKPKISFRSVLMKLKELLGFDTSLYKKLKQVSDSCIKKLASIFYKSASVIRLKKKYDKKDIIKAKMMLAENIDVDFVKYNNIRRAIGMIQDLLIASKASEQLGVALAYLGEFINRYGIDDYVSVALFCVVKAIRKLPKEESKERMRDFYKALKEIYKFPNKTSKYVKFTKYFLDIKTKFVQEYDFNVDYEFDVNVPDILSAFLKKYDVKLYNKFESFMKKSKVEYTITLSDIDMKTLEIFTENLKKLLSELKMTKSQYYLDIRLL